MGANSSTNHGTEVRSSTVKPIVSSNDIVVFQRDGCPYCDIAVNKLQQSGYIPTIINATQDQRNELSETTKSGSVPSIWIKGKYVGGCNDGPEPWMGITRILKDNKIQKLLNGEDI